MKPETLTAIAAVAPALLGAAALLLVRYPLLFLAYRQLRGNGRRPWSLVAARWIGRLALALLVLPLVQLGVATVEQGYPAGLIGVTLLMLAFTLAAMMIDTRVGWAMRRLAA